MPAPLNPRLNLPKGIRDIVLRTVKGGGATVMGGTAMLGNPPYDIDGPALTGQLPIERLSTDDTDTTHAVVPDGAGGITTGPIPTPTLEEVLTAGNDAGTHTITGTNGVLDLTDDGAARLQGKFGTGDAPGITVYVYGGSDAHGGYGAVVLAGAADGAGNDGRLGIYTGGSSGELGDVLISDGASRMVWRPLGRSIVVGFDAAGSPLALGAEPMDIPILSDRALTGWVLIADQPGAVTLSVLVGTLADLEAGTPPAVSLTGGYDPALVGGMAATGTLAGWTTALAAGDVVRVGLSAVDGVVTKVTLTLVTT